MPAGKFSTFIRRMFWLTGTKFEIIVKSSFVEKKSDWLMHPMLASQWFTAECCNQIGFAPFKIPETSSFPLGRQYCGVPPHFTTPFEAWNTHRSCLASLVMVMTGTPSSSCLDLDCLIAIGGDAKLTEYAVPSFTNVGPVN
ncbi:predicted protein [Sclerotinia sclerotiorum 1980 UF-70]|uniref:Uncharacterized protein n=1 Tax=Sclerotinia sclerotiorum (strain ATCC 18683 / 1980 / Ss-1) TaxID=665079 RepID=A7ED73_SCLS1|nr:predicted protein [Sclerotinia sclerotiorum 1980 UF-70]EDO00789.1 predicted protein [Sclerotinia sclerotiorum 1980 UF-70]